MDSKKRILIVDDEPINLEFFDVMLSKLGFDIHLAENGHEALETVRKIEPDLIILDNIMPKLTGWEVTKILKNDPEYSRYADIPIIMFSALDDVKDKVEGLELGADDYITKPFNFTEVLARIRVVLRTHDLIKQIENREKRIKMADAILEAVEETSGQLRLGLEAIKAAGNGNAAVLDGSQDLLGRLGAMEERIEGIRREADNLSEQAADLSSIRQKVRVEIAH